MMVNASARPIPALIQKLTALIRSSLIRAAHCSFVYLAIFSPTHHTNNCPCDCDTTDRTEHTSSQPTQEKSHVPSPHLFRRTGKFISKPPRSFVCSTDLRWAVLNGSTVCFHSCLFRYCLFARLTQNNLRPRDRCPMLNHSQAHPILIQEHSITAGKALSAATVFTLQHSTKCEFENQIGHLSTSRKYTQRDCNHTDTSPPHSRLASTCAVPLASPCVRLVENRQTLETQSRGTSGTQKYS